ncbi:MULTISPECIES: DUF3575 domain-containing protein [Chryseobacterium]|uniref:DUF3575 domain-containing protein n=1 Tax=Chryseobacterium scophthalmum TaxID=59733 RepID=A0A1N6IDE6_9FLAO|nr:MULTISPECIES: DUF3575 domain-containing protein [Chryseobacterium]MBM7420954.1 hypothetical protein [Chryseobacterium sp. JUb44]MDH6210911.1 hypothetical protein [Chryseobacterium sp. BIGb0186]WSO09579.1 DUF3575 domain-containing protein [Chryseobacterium scophthalmum]SIO29981.1 Protein of unknown function [Chryseobacterium scophthalmum]
MKKLLFALIPIISNLIFAQESKESNWILKLNATQLVDVVSYPTLQISAERKINPYFSVNAEFGYQLYDFSKADTLLLKSKGFKTNLEGRVYLFKLLNSRIESKRNEFYVGLQLFYRENEGTNSVDFSPKSDETKFYTDNFETKRTAKGFNITFGNQISISKKIILEPYLGLGMMNRKINNSDIEYDQIKDTRIGTGLKPLFQKLNLEESSGNVFNFCFGLRVGYRL